jgi:hypothetical protein
VHAAIDVWRATGKVPRVWAHDAAVWTGHDEDAWLAASCVWEALTGVAGDVLFSLM